MHGVSGVTGQHKGLFRGAGHHAHPARGTGQLQRPHGTLCRQRHVTQGQATGLCQFGGKGFGSQTHQVSGPQRVDGPDQRHFTATFTAQGQQRQDLGLGFSFARHLAPGEPLASHATVRPFAEQTGRHGVLLIGLDVKSHAQLCAGQAVAAFTNHSEGSGHGGLHDFDQRLKLNGCRQACFQHGHVHHPVEFACAQVGGVKSQFTAVVAKDLHLVHRCDGRAVRPAAQVLQNALRSPIERVGPHVGACAFDRCIDQRHAQTFAGQQQCQSAAHNAGATDAYIGRVSHGCIVGGSPSAPSGHWTTRPCPSWACPE